MATRSYKNAEITVLWDSDLCVHCRNCVTGLPEVFDMDARPWVNINGAPAKAIHDQVMQCPSGALAIGEKDTSQFVRLK